MIDEPEGCLVVSRRFGIDPDDEEEQPNPLLFGRELAEWLAAKLAECGYEVEPPFTEDWGWCVMCQRQPFRLFVGCVSALDENLLLKVKDPSEDLDLMWQIMPMPSKPLFSRVDTEPALLKLATDIREILDTEPDIRMASEAEIERWNDTPTEELIAEFYGPFEPQRVSRWISIPLSIILLPILLICTIGGISLWIDNPPEYDTARKAVGAMVLTGILLIASALVRLVFPPDDPDPSLFPPTMLRVAGVVVALVPIALFASGEFMREPATSLVHYGILLAVGYGLWQLGRAKT